MTLPEVANLREGGVNTEVFDDGKCGELSGAGR